MPPPAVRDQPAVQVIPATATYYFLEGTLNTSTQWRLSRRFPSDGGISPTSVWSGEIGESVRSPRTTPRNLREFSPVPPGGVGPDLRRILRLRHRLLLRLGVRRSRPG